MRLLFTLATVAALGLVTGCTATSTCGAIDAAHQAFLDEVAADPDGFTKEQIRNERRAYTAAKIGCTAFVQTSPVVTK